MGTFLGPCEAACIGIASITAEASRLPGLLRSGSGETGTGRRVDMGWGEAQPVKARLTTQNIRVK